MDKALHIHRRVHDGKYLLLKCECGFESHIIYWWDGYQTAVRTLEPQLAAKEKQQALQRLGYRNAVDWLKERHAKEVAEIERLRAQLGDWGEELADRDVT